MKTKKAKKANVDRYKGIFFKIGLIISIALTTLAFQWRVDYPINTNVGPVGEDEFPDEIEIPATVQRSKPVLPKMTEFKLVEDDIPVKDVPVVDESIDNNFKVEIPDDIRDMDQEETFSAPSFPIDAGNKMPEFLGGDPALAEYLKKNTEYPDIDQSYGLEGYVVLSFVIDNEGFVTKVRVEGGSGTSRMKKEALRVFANMPKWEPGLQNWRKVGVKMGYKLEFKLTD